MKIKDIVLPALFAVICTWSVQNIIEYFTARNKGDEISEVRAGQSFVAPKKEQLIKPLMMETDFLDADIACKNSEYQLETERLIIKYGSCGGVITQITSKRLPEVEHKQLTFIDIQPEEREKSAFLVALQEKTPLNYQLIAEVPDKEAHTIHLKTKTAVCTIDKEFRFLNDSYKVDFTLTVEPHMPEGVQPRVFIPSPNLTLKNSYDFVQGIMFSDNNVLEKKKPDELEGRLWVMPTLFGTEDRYFIMALVADPANFVQRAYYKVTGTHQLTAILEGPMITQRTSWKMSFYCGPKHLAEMMLVDRRLEGALDYGWLGPISKLSMSVLNYIYRYVHNYGWAIIILTLLIKLLLLPFSLRAEKSAKRAAEMKKKLHYLEQKYKNDPETLAREKNELYRKSGLFDIGCLSIFVQIPILLALNRALSTSIELYKAPFFGWIHDLSAIDPFYVFPALVGLGMVLHAGGSSDPRQRMVTLFMALVVGGVMTNLAVGLVIFIGASTWLSIAQTKIQKALKI